MPHHRAALIWRGYFIPPRVQWKIFQAFDGKCACCGRIIGPGERWQLDHIIALANGGEHREGNLQPLLFMHHLLKTKRYHDRAELECL